MDHSNDQTNFLLESIRNELVSIIEDKEGINRTEIPEKCIRHPLVRDFTGDEGNNDEHHKFRIPHKSDGSPMPLPNGLLEPHSSKIIDEDLQCLRVDLNESYKLFKNIEERFENINFGCLKSRIKDLHLNESKSDSIKSVVNDLKSSVDETYFKNRLSDLTKEVSLRFQKHPGEFGDIPELAEFFRACGQLQHGLERLKKERRRMQNLTMRISQVSQMSCSRIKDMQRTLKSLCTTDDIEKNNNI